VAPCGDRPGTGARFAVTCPASRPSPRSRPAVPGVQPGRRWPECATG
jgi:hypothetical protein